ncbi:MAG TPA: ThiF family adenylyltransferase [Pyrinomonadaceae bacterium]|jgi:hypothetical protein
MKTPVSLTMDEALYRRLHDHLFPGDYDEHGAVIVAGIAETERGARLLAREVLLARDGVDYVPGTRGYRALTAQFVAQQSDYCAAQKLCYLAVHCHGGLDSVRFSGDDLASHERGYPALLDITNGGPVGALVFAREAVAGDIWTPEGRFELDHATIVGPRVRKLYPNPRPRPRHADPVYDRHARLFGDLGQEILSGLKVGIIGLGGGGSLINEWLSRLGVGHIVAVDFDRVESSNLPRVVGATRWDAMAWLAGRRSIWLRELGRRFASRKVHVARRVALRANPNIRFDAVVGNVLNEPTARLLTDVDFLFLASDSIQSRLVFNALVHQYLIPGVQIGAKVPVDRKSGTVGDAFVATRPVLPYAGAGCLNCHELIPAARLQEEALSENERRAQRYVESEDVAEPSVITLNVLSAAQAVNDMMMMFTGLYHQGVNLHHQINFVRERLLTEVGPMADEFCMDCSDTVQSLRARGDRLRLPCRARV